jgi:hypothetical protein
MIEQCKFIEGEKGVQCNRVKGLTALRQQFGDMFSVNELKKLMCESSKNGDCPAFKRNEELGKRSEYATTEAIIFS